MHANDHSARDIAYHDAIAAEYDQVVLAPREQGTAALFASMHHYLPDKRHTMLDLGAGTGQMTLRLGGLFERVVAVDHSRGMLDVARSNVRQAELENVTFEIGDAFDFLARNTQRFDLITCVGFLHHIEPARLPDLFAHIAGHLADDGVFIFAEPLATDAVEPALIRRWNQAFRTHPPDYVAQQVEDPDEAPIAIEALNAACDHAGLQRAYERRGWEIFPRRQPPGLIDRIGIRVLDSICPRNGPIYWAACARG